MSDEGASKIMHKEENGLLKRKRSSTHNEVTSVEKHD